MFKKIIFLNVLIIPFLILSGCGTPITVQLPEVQVEANDSGEGVTVSIPATDDSDTAPAQGDSSNNIFLYVLVGAVVLIALVAVISLGAKRSHE
ncbi:MAG: hypothetical protein R6W69_10430 [Anaerolineales bacterium]